MKSVNFFKNTMTFIIMLGLSSGSFSNALWKDVPARVNLKSHSDFHHRPLSVDYPLLQQQLWLAPMESSGQPPITIELPLPNNEFITVDVVESPILSDEIAAKFPSIKTFKTTQTDNPAYTGRLDVTPQGFHAMLRTPDGIVYINPEDNYSKETAKDRYRSFKKSNTYSTNTFTCHTESRSHQPDTTVFFYPEETDIRLPAKKRFGSTIRTYRLALAATSEYNDAVGGGNKNTTLAEMITAINRVNEIYTQDIAVKLKLVTGTELISSNPDDFSNNNGSMMLLQNQKWIDAKTGSANYDIGHIFSTGGGGLAQVGSVCDGDGDGIEEYKAQGVTGNKNPIGDTFYVDYVAHELGHQFGATHTFNADGSAAGDCSGNRVGKFYSGNITFLASSAYEVGSGSTIMGYAGICDDQNLQSNTDSYFHGRSIEQIRELIDGEIAAAEPDLFWADGSICGTPAFTGDVPPNVDAGEDYTIPANTPFILTGDAYDTNSDESTFIYTWEQFDLGNATKSLSAMHTDQGSGPLIRSFPGSASPIRYVPSLDAIIAGNLTANIGERLPSTDRTLNFRLTLRSGTNGVDQDDMEITVDSQSGPFSVTAPTNIAPLQGFHFVDTRWNVASTNTTPVNCNLVTISFSSDGGNTFPITLLSNTANDGGEYVLLPNLTTSAGRVKVQCSDNIFFNISPEDLAISAIANPSTPTLAISDASQIESTNSCSNNYTFHISRTGVTAGSNSVNYTVSGSGINPATADDFPGSFFPSGTMTFSGEETLKTVSISLNPSASDIAGKTFSVFLSNATDAVIEDAYGEATITEALCNTPVKGDGKSSNNDSSGTTSFWLLCFLFSIGLTKKLNRIKLI